MATHATLPSPALVLAATSAGATTAAIDAGGNREMRNDARQLGARSS